MKEIAALQNRIKDQQQTNNSSLFDLLAKIKAVTEEVIVQFLDNDF